MEPPDRIVVGPLAIGLALALLAADIAAWRIVSRLFDRERVVTG